ncbi:MFS transporter [Microbacterium elymi]|uniref:MFS transporter n=1 Tax=Microbacterium elymi TaxID=2909587 RepID=A0ABY5NGT5_9MICO|nr:MFS transporter [Microbacterium elymi]UUT34385.1 MFS transporter [Microbacterium elymi]
MSSTQTTTIIASRGSVRATFAAAFLSVALAQTAYAIPGALNGAFAAEFHASGAGLTWITAIFEIGIVAFELTFGLLGDLFGRKKLMVAGSALVIVGAALSAVAGTIGFMIFAQAVIGIGAGLLFPIGLAMVAALTPDPRRRARVIAMWAGFLSLGAVISPVMAGLTDQFFTVPGAAPGAPNVFSGWRVSYWVIVVVAIVLVFVSLATRDSSAPAGRKLDIPGQITFAVGLIAVLYATVTAVDSGWSAWQVIAGYIVGAVTLAAFIVIELRSKAPLLHLSLFKNRAYSIGSIVAVIGMFAFLATAFSTSISVGALQQSPVWVLGVLFVCIQGPAFVLAPLVGRLIHSVSPRWILTVGFAFIAASGYWLSTYKVGVPAQFGGAPWQDFLAPLLLLGIGFALTIGSITAVAINTVQAARDRHGVGDHQPHARPRLHARTRRGLSHRVRSRRGRLRRPDRGRADRCWSAGRGRRGAVAGASAGVALGLGRRRRPVRRSAGSLGRPAGDRRRRHRSTERIAGRHHGAGRRIPRLGLPGRLSRRRDRRDRVGGPDPVHPKQPRRRARHRRRAGQDRQGRGHRGLTPPGQGPP